MIAFFLLFIGLPALEVFLMIEIGGKIGALNTVLLIFLTVIIGLYFAKLEGIKTMRSGIINLYQNKIPIYEMVSGASIALAALFLIIPGFFTDAIGFMGLIPITRFFIGKTLISLFIKNRSNFAYKSKQDINDPIEGEFEEVDNKDEN